MIFNNENNEVPETEKVEVVETETEKVETEKVEVVETEAEQVETEKNLTMKELDKFVNGAMDGMKKDFVELKTSYKNIEAELKDVKETLNRINHKEVKPEKEIPEYQKNYYKE